jgi:hypothetical protein
LLIERRGHAACVARDLLFPSASGCDSINRHP